MHLGPINVSGKCKMENYLDILPTFCKNGQKMIVKCFRGQNRDMQNLSRNLDNFNFGPGFEPSTYKLNPVTLTTRLCEFNFFVSNVYLVLTRLVELNRTALIVFIISNLFICLKNEFSNFYYRCVVL